MKKQDAKAFIDAGGDIDQLRHCKDALKTGTIRNVQEYLDPTLNPVLNKSVARIGQGPGLWWGWAETSEVGPMAGKR